VERRDLFDVFAQASQCISGWRPCPAFVLALRSSLGILKDMEGKLTPKHARQLVEHWLPWRSVGSLFLWHYYRGAPN
jgi:3-methyladenine DNA glycosylase/8-oxoguanine DNA glycosylase